MVSLFAVRESLGMWARDALRKCRMKSYANLTSCACWQFMGMDTFVMLV